VNFVIKPDIVYGPSGNSTYVFLSLFDIKLYDISTFTLII